MAAELVYPGILARVPDNKDHHLLPADRGKQIWIREYLTPLHCDSFVTSLDGLKPPTF